MKGAEMIASLVSSVRIIFALALATFISSASAQVPNGPSSNAEALVPVTKALDRIGNERQLIASRGKTWKETHSPCKELLAKAVQQQGGGSTAIGHLNGSLWAGMACLTIDSTYSSFYGGPLDVLDSAAQGLKGHEFVTSADLEQLDAKIAEWKQKERELNNLAAQLMSNTADHAVCYETHQSIDPECERSGNGIDSGQDALRKLFEYRFAYTIEGGDRLAVDLKIDDVGRAARADKLRAPISALEQQISSKERELKLRQDQLTEVKSELKSTTETVDAAQRKLEVALGDLGYFVQEKLNAEIAKTERGIAYLEKYIKENSAEPRSASKDDLDLAVSTLAQAKQHYANLTSPFPTLEINELNTKDPGDSFDAAAKRFTEALASLQDLLPRQKDQYDRSSSLDAEIVQRVMDLQELDRNLAEKKRELYEKASSAIERIDASVGRSHVLQAVYSAEDAQMLEMLRDVKERLAAEQEFLQQALEDRNNAKQAFVSETRAALDASGKLGGWTGAIMLNASSHAALEVLDVGLAARKGGVYGALTETLTKASDFAVKYVLSGGKDVGYEGVDESAIEAQVRAGVPTGLNRIPSIQQLEERLPEAPVWASERVKDKVWDKIKDKTKEKGIETCTGPITPYIVKTQFPVPLKSGFDPAVKAERARLSSILQKLRESEPSPLDDLKAARPTSALKVYARQSALKMGEALGQYAAKKYEEILWRRYFEHDIQARALFEVYRGFNQIYLDELDRFVALQNEQLDVMSRCGDPNPFRVQKNGFTSASADREVSILFKMHDVEPDKLVVTVQGAAARLVAPNRFSGTLPHGVPDDAKMHITVTTQ